MIEQPVDAGDLELRYRRWLRVLPPAYRAVREQEMVDTFLDSRYADQPELSDLTAIYGRPSLAEKLSVLGLALRLRWGGVDAPDRYRARGEATRTFAVLGLLMLATWTILMLQARWGGTPWWPEPQAPQSMSSGSVWDLITWNAPLLWVPAFICVVSGRPRIGQVVGLLALLPQLAELVAQPGLFGFWLQWFVHAAVVAAIGAFRPDTPPVARRPWLVAGAVIIVALQPLPLVARLPAGVAWSLVDETGLWSVAAVVIGCVAIIWHPRWRTGEQRTGHLLGVAAFAATAALLGLGRLADFAATLPAGESLRSTVLLAGALQLAAVAAAGIPLVVAGFRALRRLPAVSYSVDRAHPSTAG